MAPAATPSVLDPEIRGHVEPVGSLATQLMVVTRPVPSGPRGLWQALEAAGQAPAPLRTRSVLPEVHHEAHLQYLAALA